MTSTVGAYELLERIAVGGAAQIFLARKSNGQGFDQRFAVKLLHDKHVDSDQQRQMLIDEARLTASLDHPNIIAVQDLGEDGSTLFFVMEYIDGLDLARVISTARTTGTHIPADIAAFLGIQVCDGLHYAHTKTSSDGRPLEIVHRDVSPQNIVIGFGGEVKLIDFGVAKAQLGGRIETRTGIIKGKLTYMAPEYAIGAQQDPRSDIFAVGLCLYEALTGRPAYLFDDPQELMHAVKFATIEPPRSLRPDIPRALETVVMQAVAQHPNDRFQTAAQMRDALSAALSEFAPDSGKQGLAQWMRGIAALAPGPITGSEAPTDESGIDDDFANEATNLVRIGDPSNDATGPMNRDELAGLSDLHEMARDGAAARAGGRESAEDELSVMQTMASESEEPPPLAAMSDLDPSDIAPQEAVLDVLLEPVDGDFDGGPPTSTNIDRNRIAADAAERDAQPDKPQILTQSGFSRFLSKEQIEAIRNPQNAPTRPTAPLDEWTEREMRTVLEESNILTEEQKEALRAADLQAADGGSDATDILQSADARADDDDGPATEVTSAPTRSNSGFAPPDEPPGGVTSTQPAALQPVDDYETADVSTGSLWPSDEGSPGVQTQPGELKPVPGISFGEPRGLPRPDSSGPATEPAGLRPPPSGPATEPARVLPASRPNTQPAEILPTDTNQDDDDEFASAPTMAAHPGSAFGNPDASNPGAAPANPGASFAPQGAPAPQGPDQTAAPHDATEKMSLQEFTKYQEEEEAGPKQMMSRGFPTGAFPLWGKKNAEQPGAQPSGSDLKQVLMVAALAVVFIVVLAFVFLTAT